MKSDVYRFKCVRDKAQSLLRLEFYRNVILFFLCVCNCCGVIHFCFVKSVCVCVQILLVYRSIVWFLFNDIVSS